MINAATVAEKRPVFELISQGETVKRWGETNKYEDPVRVVFPAIRNGLITLFRSG